MSGELLTAVALLLAPALASADTSSTLTVVGTSDVSDSGLIPNLIQPEFQKAYPQFTFKYVGSATGAAIQSAESGTGGPSALIVHAASLENQFVAGGYSYNNQYGNAIFTNDFVLAGPAGDPAGVGGQRRAQHRAGVRGHRDGRATDGKATFVYARRHHDRLRHDRRGAPDLAARRTARAAAGGPGAVRRERRRRRRHDADRSSDSVTSTASRAPTAAPSAAPDAPVVVRHHRAHPGPNVIAANACTARSPAAPNTCYVLTDRGTFDYLASGTDPAGTIPNLRILTRDDSASAPGGADELVNYFHAYIINPSSRARRST